MDASSSEQPLSINHQCPIKIQFQPSLDSARQIQFQNTQLALPSSFHTSSPSNLSPEISGSRPPDVFTKTRKLSSSRKNRHTWSKDACYLTDDGFQWRKYGQKVIQNEKYPRNYFRCTYKDDQGCLATKQVQRIQEGPPIYRTTYYGHHSCKTHDRSIDDIISKTSSSSRGCFSLVIPNSDKESCKANSKIHCSSNSTTSFNLLITAGEQVVQSKSSSTSQYQQQPESIEKSSLTDLAYNAASPDSNGGKDLKLLQTAEPLNLTLSLSLSM